jgi:2-polyprenyl-3-methyl-5-hydroxy-6-metoxy-1,4-benzoquinol methylase
MAKPSKSAVVDLLGDEGYAANFGLQWNAFQLTQFDSNTGKTLTRDRLLDNSKWSDIAGKKVLEAGSGAGRFTEVFISLGAELTTFDMSSAIFANEKNNGDKGDVQFYRASVYDMPFEKGAFDLVFCFGVLQHTPDPDRAFRELWSMVKPGGKISVDFYRKMPVPTSWSTPKYFWRPLTRRMKPETLLKIVRWYVPKWLPIDTAIKKLPMGNFIGGVTFIPCWNYWNMGLPKDQWTEWAIMDTFDALGAAYDTPRTRKGVLKLLEGCEGVASHECFKGSTGWVLNATKLKA